MISKALSNSFKVANLVCTILIVSIHYNTKHDMDLSSGLSWNFYLQEFLTNGIARIAVPFFALVAGFFLLLRYDGIRSYPIAIKKRITSLFIPFLLASSLVFIADYFYGKIMWRENVNELSQLATFILFRPISIQFWFLRDLILLTLISPIIFVALKQGKGFIPFFFLGLWFIDIEIMPLFSGRYLITIETLAFFILGGYLARNSQLLERLIKVTSGKLLYLSLILYFSLLLLRITLEPTMSNWYHDNYQLHTLLLQNSSIFIGVILVILLSSRIIHDKLLYLAQFTFFVYLFHVLPFRYLIGKIASYLIDDAHKFYVTFPLALIGIFLCAIVFQKLWPRCYTILSGGR